MNLTIVVVSTNELPLADSADVLPQAESADDLPIPIIDENLPLQKVSILLYWCESMSIFFNITIANNIYKIFFNCYILVLNSQN